MLILDLLVLIEGPRILILEKLNINTRKASYRLENGILICELKPELIIDIKTAVSLVNERLKITGGKSYPFLLIVRDYLLLDNVAFKYFGTKEGVMNLQASAIVIDSPLQKMVTNFNLLFYRHPTPFRVFNKKSEAKLWLFEFVKKNEKDLFKNLLSS